MTAPDPHGGFVAMAADLARSTLLIRRADGGGALDQNIRRTRIGRTRGTSAEGVLTLTTFALQHFSNARPKSVRKILGGMFDMPVLQVMGLTRLDVSGGTEILISEDQWHRFWGLVADNLAGERLFALINRLLLGWVTDPPLGDTLLFDATLHQSSARPLSKDLRRQLDDEGSEDLLLASERESLSEAEQRRLSLSRRHRAHEARWGKATATYSQPRQKAGGFHIHPVVSASSDGPGAAPTLVVAADVTPLSGYKPAGEFLKLLDFADERCGTEFLLVADRAYSDRLSLWEELRGRGRKFAFDLDEDQVKERGEHDGVLLLQGNGLCPGTPRELRNPGTRPMTKVHDEPNPEYATWLDRVAAQMPYRCHVRSNRQNGINVSCPALGPPKTMECIHRGIDSESSLETVLEPPYPKPKICSQQTVFIPDAINDLRQTLPWGRADWLRVHRGGRSHDEGVHGEIKNPHGYDLRRMVTGSSRLAVVAVHIALVLALFNLEKLRTWVQEHPEHPFSLRAATDPLLGPDELAVEWLRTELAKTGGRG